MWDKNELQIANTLKGNVTLLNLLYVCICVYMYAWDTCVYIRMYENPRSLMVAMLDSRIRKKNRRVYLHVELYLDFFAVCVGRRKERLRL